MIRMARNADAQWRRRYANQQVKRNSSERRFESVAETRARKKREPDDRPERITGDLPGAPQGSGQRQLQSEEGHDPEPAAVAERVKEDAVRRANVTLFVADQVRERITVS